MAKFNDYTLRDIEDNDSEMVFLWRNTGRVRENMYTDDIIKLEEHQKWFNAMQKDISCKYLIFEFKGRPVGVVYFTDIDKTNNKAYFGMYLGEEEVPLGTGGIFEYFVLDYAFNIMSLRKLSCEVLSFNERVIAMHKGFGFRIEGVFEKHIRKNEDYCDVVSLAVFSNVWTKKSDILRKALFIS